MSKIIYPNKAICELCALETYPSRVCMGHIDCWCEKGKKFTTHVHSPKQEENCLQTNIISARCLKGAEGCALLDNQHTHYEFISNK